jgi:hypothetical protein
VDKIKKAFAVIGAVLTVIVCTLFLVFLRRRDSDGQGSSGIDERDSRIQEGLDGASDTAKRCEERLRRAEEILRGAIERGEKEKH